jgi:hypothetical protein
MRLRTASLRSRALVALAAWGVASPAAAETVEGPGFEVTIPAGFARAAQDVERGMEDGLVAQRREAGVWTEGRPRVWIYVKTYEVGEAKIVVNREPRRTPPADDPEFLRGQRIGLDRLVKAQGGTVEPPRGRTTAGGLLVSEGRAHLAPGTPEAVEVFMSVLPREGFGVALSLYASGGAREQAEATWESLLASLTSDAPPPKSAPERWSPKAIQGLVWSVTLVVAGIVAAVLLWRQRRATARWREAQARDKAEGAGSGGEPPGP